MCEGVRVWSRGGGIRKDTHVGVLVRVGDRVCASPPRKIIKKVRRMKLERAFIFFFLPENLVGILTPGPLPPCRVFKLPLALE